VQIDLAAMAARVGQGPKRRRVVELPVITPTTALAADLASVHMKALRAWRDQLNLVVLPAYTATLGELRDGFTDAMVISDDLADVRNATEGAAASVTTMLAGLTPSLRAWALRLERWHRLKFARLVMTPTGVDLLTMVGPEDVRETLEAVLARNVALVRSVSDETRGRISDIVFRGFQKRTPAREVARQMTQAVGLGRARSLRIASDQAVKLSSELDTERFRQVGIERWKWRHSGKKHFRPEHRARSGNVYTFKKPPPDMPGEKPYCGCKKQAILTLGAG
jgi:SPP1 gp7 family putative phage head morphogenesis protein